MRTYTTGQLTQMLRKANIKNPEQNVEKMREFLAALGVTGSIAGGVINEFFAEIGATVRLNDPRTNDLRRAVH